MQGVLQRGVGGLFEHRVGTDDRERVFAGFTENELVTREVCERQQWQPRLTGADEVTWSADFEVRFSDLKAIAGLSHDAEATPGIVTRATRRDQQAFARVLATTDAAAKLVQLRQAK